MEKLITKLAQEAGEHLVAAGRTEDAELRDRLRQRGLIAADRLREARQKREER